jgi:hypothetical protein
MAKNVKHNEGTIDKTMSIREIQELQKTILVTDMDKQSHIPVRVI